MKTSTPQAPTAQPSRGMWVWNTQEVIKPGGQAQQLLANAHQTGLTDVYLYVAPTHYTERGADLRAFNAKAHGAGVRVWGLDGARAYFSDADGPGEFFSGIDGIVRFNQSAPPAERFDGFQADNEPQDNATYKAFHNEVKDSALNQSAGSGVWQPSQAWDREVLMRDWLHIHKAAQGKLHAAGLRFGAAIPSWIGDYNGEPLRVNYPNNASPRKTVMAHMMACVDDYVLMTYNIYPANAARRALPHLQVAQTLSPLPRVHASVEVTRGVGQGVSYADSPGKDSQRVVAQDIQTIIDTLKSHPGFAGVSLHQWSGWQALRP